MPREVTVAETELIAEATAQGFMDCPAVVRALGFEMPPTRWAAAYRFIHEAGEPVAFVIPDGYTGVRRALRTGVYADAFPRVLAYKEAYYARVDHDNWKANMDRALAVRAEYPEEEEFFKSTCDEIGPEPPAPDWELLEACAQKAEALDQSAKQKAEALNQASKQEYEDYVRDQKQAIQDRRALQLAIRPEDWQTRVMEVMEERPGSLNRRGYPATFYIREQSGIHSLTHREKRELWNEVQDGS